MSIVKAINKKNFIVNFFLFLSKKWSNRKKLKLTKTNKRRSILFRSKFKPEKLKENTCVGIINESKIKIKTKFVIYFPQQDKHVSKPLTHSSTI